MEIGWKWVNRRWVLLAWPSWPSDVLHTSACVEADGRPSLYASSWSNSVWWVSSADLTDAEWFKKAFYEWSMLSFRIKIQSWIPPALIIELGVNVLLVSVPETLQWDLELFYLWKGCFCIEKCVRPFHVLSCPPCPLPMVPPPDHDPSQRSLHQGTYCSFVRSSLTLTGARAFCSFVLSCFPVFTLWWADYCLCAPCPGWDSDLGHF